MNTFKDYILATYEQDELKVIAEHGCASCAPGGMIYYYETTDLYLNHKEALHEIVAEYKDTVGEMPKFIIDSLDDFTQFANAMVWFCTEIIAYEETENEEAA